MTRLDLRRVVVCNEFGQSTGILTQSMLIGELYNNKETPLSRY
jgi:hypothetical protein